MSRSRRKNKGRDSGRQESPAAGGIAFSDIVYAYDYMNAGPAGQNEVYLDRRTGEFHYYSPQIDFERRLPKGIEHDAAFIAIPHKNDLDLGRNLALQFAEEHFPHDAERVHEMFRHSGAYRRFKNFLGDRDALNQWHQYELEATQRALLAWCAEEGIPVLNPPAEKPASAQAPGPIATHGLTHLALAVADAHRAAAFYAHVFGSTIVYDQGGVVQIQTPGAHDAIVFDESLPRRGEIGGIAHFGFRLKNPADIHRAAERVRAAGGAVTSQGEFTPGEPYLFATDPDGYEIEIWYEKPTA